MAATTQALLGLSAAKLDAMFVSAEAGALPMGEGAGTALIVTGTPLASAAASLAGALWRGKDFSSSNQLMNIFGPARKRAIRADVYESPSIIDGRPCIVLDYSRTSKVARWIRDEIREVDPGRYLGMVFITGRKLPVRFCLTFEGQAVSRPQAA